jgi:hypothetical protein
MKLNKKLFCISVLASLLFILTELCLADYIIHLKDGRSFTTPEYREEGDQIKFVRYGGLIGLPREQVVSIEENLGLTQKEESDPAKAEGFEKERRTGTDKQREPEKKENVEDMKKAKNQGTPSEMSEKEKKNFEWEKIAKMQKLLEEKRQIMMEKAAVITSYKEAKARKNKKKKKQYWNELLSLQKKFDNLRERAVAENGGGLPEWWDDAR